MSRSQRDTGGEHGEFVVTNWTSALSLDCNTVTLGEVADTLGTLIKVLTEQGVIAGTVSA